jgi:cytochrome c peroxidase
LQCATCHSGFNFTDYNFYNIGLYKNYQDPGRWKVTEKEEDRGKFKTPTLRNIALSAPYMHDGSIKSLDKVIEFKMSGGVKNENKSIILSSFNLDENDKEALIAFLKTLSDPSFIERETERENRL